MEKNIFRSVSKRENVLLNGIYGIFFALASYPRLTLEVFIRRDMGRRYYTVASAVTIAIVLLILPPWIFQWEVIYTKLYGEHWGDYQDLSFWGEFSTWYAFVLLFIWFCYKRRQETFPHSNVYDFNHFSLSTGKSLPFLNHPPFLKNKPSGYHVEVFIEPAFFFVIGFLLKFMNQPVGTLLVVCSVCYALSYAAAYKQQDDYYQDLIDQIIIAEETERAFVYGYESSRTRGVDFGRRPSDENLRRKMASKFYPKNDVEDAEFTVL